MSNPFSIGEHHGALTFFKNGRPIFPLLFWQTEILEEDAQAFSAAGVELFSFFRTIPHYKHPYWIGDNQYDFSHFDTAIREFHKQLPAAYCIPRIYVSAPDWWLKQHPEELCGFAVDAPRTDYHGDWQGSFHESFASELWKQEMGQAFRHLIHHLRKADYADCIIGVHVCCGITGEWHLWSPQLRPDTSPAMERRYGKPIPPPEQRDAAYYQCMNEATVDAIDHFCRIVKEESDFLTTIFYGYTPDMGNTVPWGIEGDHRAAALMHRLKSVDIVSSPHSYERRTMGMDGYFRNYPASLALHGKLFIDEGDDRTWLDGKNGNGVEYVRGVIPENLEESIHVLRREFGNMLTHNIGMWYMDLNGGNFHDAVLMAEIARLKRWGDYYMRLQRTRSAKVAVIAAPESEFYLPPRGTPGNLDNASRYIGQIGELCKTGAPFDFYVSADLASSVMENYQIIFCLDTLALSEPERQRLRQLRSSGRTFIWFNDAGAIVNGTRSSDYSCELTGLASDEISVVQPVERSFSDWRSINLGTPVVSSRTLRQIFRSCGVHIYLDSDDVVSVSDGAMMVHAATEGEKSVRLPAVRRITDLVSEKVFEADEFSFFLRRGETALFLFEQV